MSRNTSYDSSSTQKPRCHICGNVVALSASQCPNCGNRNFHKVGNVLRKNACFNCHGNGKAQWTSDNKDGWQKPDKDYCCTCHGRGYFLTYSVIDRRTNEVSSRHHDINDSNDASIHYREYDIPAVQPINCGKAPRPTMDGLELFITLVFYTFLACVFFTVLAMVRGLNNLLNLISF